MRYFCDTEFDGFGGPLLSLALIREDNEAIYIVYEHNVENVKDAWVKQNVVPILWKIPSPMPGMAYRAHSDAYASTLLQQYFNGDKMPMIITDWPDDIAYLCKAVITSPGEMINIPRLIFDMVRVDAYPTTVKNAVQHNAYWDAQALRMLFHEEN